MFAVKRSEFVQTKEYRNVKSIIIIIIISTIYFNPSTNQL